MSSHVNKTLMLRRTPQHFTRMVYADGIWGFNSVEQKLEPSAVLRHESLCLFSLLILFASK